MEINEITRVLGNWTDAKGSLHSRLGEALERGIEQGLILPGTRLPAERTLAKALTLSRTTVLTAYSNLKADGWLRAALAAGHGSATGAHRSPGTEPTPPF